MLLLFFLYKEGLIMNVTVAGNNAKGNETLSVGASAVGFVSIPSGTTKAIVTCETASIRYWISGTLPTVSAGHLVNAGDVIELDSSGQVTNFKTIAVSGTASLQITYF